MTPETRASARELLQRARRGDRDAAYVLVDVLDETGHQRLAEGLMSTLERHKTSVPLHLLVDIDRELFPERCIPPRVPFIRLMREAETELGWNEMRLPLLKETERLLKLFALTCISGETDDARFALWQTDGALAGFGVFQLRVATRRNGIFFFDYIDLGDPRAPTVIYGRRARRFWIASTAELLNTLTRRYGFVSAEPAAITYASGRAR